MAVTPNEFYKMLIASLGADSVTRTANQLTVKTERGEVGFLLTPLPPRKIALLELPVTCVEFSYTDWSAEDLSYQQKWFDLHLRRGGG